MNAGNQRRTPRRVVVALDARSTTAPRLETVVRLAAQLNAEIHGIFVEETELIQMAALPIARSIPSHGVGEAAMSETIMRRAMRARSASLRQRLEQLSARWQVMASFEVTQGTFTEQVNRRTTAEDLLTVAADNERSTVSVTRSLSELLNRAPCAVLHLRHSRPEKAAVLVIDNGEERLLTAGLLTAQAFGGRLKILIPPHEGAGDRQRAISSWLATNNAVAETIILSETKEGVALPANLRPGTVIFDRTSKPAQSLSANLGATCALLAL